MKSLTICGALALVSDVAFAAPAPAADPRIPILPLGPAAGLIYLIPGLNKHYPAPRPIADPDIPIWAAAPNAGLAFFEPAAAPTLGKIAFDVFANKLKVTKNGGEHEETQQVGKREAAADPRLTIWEAAPELAVAAIASVSATNAQATAIPPHASGPGKPAFKDYYSNPNVLKNEGPRKNAAQGQQHQKRAAAALSEPVDANVQQILPEGDAATERALTAKATGQKDPSELSPPTYYATRPDYPPIKRALRPALLAGGRPSTYRDYVSPRKRAAVPAPAAGGPRVPKHDAVKEAQEAQSRMEKRGRREKRQLLIPQISEPVATAAIAAAGEVQGSQDASHDLAPLIEQQEAHRPHFIHIDHGEHGDGSEHDAVKEAQEAQNRMEKRERREKRLLVIPQKKDKPKQAWIAVDGVMF